MRAPISIKIIRIFKWGFLSKENTNFTYHLTAENIVSLAQLISVVTKADVHAVLDYMEEANGDTLLKESIDLTIRNSAMRSKSDPGAGFGRWPG